MCTHWIGDWVGPIVGLDTVVKRKCINGWMDGRMDRRTDGWMDK